MVYRLRVLSDPGLQCCVNLVLCSWLEGMEQGLGEVGEVFVARVVAGGKVTIPLLVREVLKIREGDYVRISISEVIREKRQQQQEKVRKRK